MSNKAKGDDAKQRTLLGFFTKKDAADVGPPSSTSRDAATTTKRPPTPPLTGKKTSPIVVHESPVKSKEAPNGVGHSEPNGIPTPPPTSDASHKMDVDGRGPDADEEDDAFASRARKAKSKRPVIAETDSETDVAASTASRAKRPRTTVAPRRRGRGGRDEDEFIDDAGDGGQSSGEASEASEASSAASTSKPPAKMGNAASKTAGSAGASTLKAPDMRRDLSSSSSTTFMKTAAQQQKEAAKQARREETVSFEFLRPDKLRDADQNRPDHPDFDPRTLHIPPREWNGLTPFEKQFWEIKKTHMDVVLFFQKGKFYELYEEDASIGHREFDLKLTDRVKMRMVGVPEGQFDLWASKFLARGYRVGRVDQAETAIGMEMRQKAGKGKDKDKIVIRQLKSVITTGTQTDGLTDDLSKHCIAIVEDLDEGHHQPTVGACLLDASTASFSLTHFVDDAARTKLETLVRQCRATEVLHIKNNLSPATMRVLRSTLPIDCQWVGMKHVVPADALDQLRALLAEAPRRHDEDDDDNEDPAAMALDEDGLPGAVSASADKVDVVKALGLMLRYLKEVNLDAELVTARRFGLFDPLRDGKRLVLDGQTLAHIEVLQNSHGGDEGSLLRLLSRCITPFGKRCFKLWLCQPLRSVTAINQRLDAVEDLMGSADFGSQFDTAAKGTPDLERLISRIHAGSCKPRDFKKVLDAFKDFGRLVERLRDSAKSFTSTVLTRLLEAVPDLAQLVGEIEAAFEMPSGNELLPLVGADEEYDSAVAAVEAVEERLKGCLKTYRSDLDDDSLVFRDIGTKEIYQVQCPHKLKVPKTWTLMSSTKEFRRYYSPEVEKLVRDLKEAREVKVAAIGGFQSRLYAQFDRRARSWQKAVEVFAQIDCLLSLCKSSLALAEPCVRPDVVEADTALLDFEDLRHPCVVSSTSDFIPNDVALGGEQRNMIILTGPNMAGKSTLLRMTGVAVIMAQLGCYVPAAKARLSPCDRITTRMGANDLIFSHASTFKVEMDDCKKILSEATPRSLVILDELGRGTSTWDGMAIAYAVLHHLATHVGCIGFFATHYSTLTKDVAYHPQIRPAHMATLVSDDEAHVVTFLYKLKDGATTKSYGPSVARMAGLDESIVRRAMSISKDLETTSAERLAASSVSIGFSLAQQADFAWLYHSSQSMPAHDAAQLARTLDIVRTSVVL